MWIKCQYLSKCLFSLHMCVGVVQTCENAHICLLGKKRFFGKTAHCAHFRTISVCCSAFSVTGIVANSDVIISSNVEYGFKDATINLEGFVNNFGIGSFDIECFAGLVFSFYTSKLIYVCVCSICV